MLLQARARISKLRAQLADEPSVEVLDLEALQKTDLYLNPDKGDEDPLPVSRQTGFKSWTSAGITMHVKLDLLSCP